MASRETPCARIQSATISPWSRGEVRATSTPVYATSVTRVPAVHVRAPGGRKPNRTFPWLVVDLPQCALPGRRTRGMGGGGPIIGNRHSAAAEKSHACASSVLLATKALVRTANRGHGG